MRPFIGFLMLVLLIRFKMDSNNYRNVDISPLALEYMKFEKEEKDKLKKFGTGLENKVDLSQ